jgi:hypothetical protein
VNVKLGTYTGTGADNRSITGVGFQPDFVLVKGGANRAVICTDTMDTGDAKCITGANGMETDQIQALEADGFQVGTSARVNANTTVYYYLALRDDGNGDFCTFSYTGNGADDRNITNAATPPGAQPTSRRVPASPSMAARRPTAFRRLGRRTFKWGRMPVLTRT